MAGNQSGAEPSVRGRALGPEPEVLRINQKCYFKLRLVAVTPPLWSFPIGPPLAPPLILHAPPELKALLAQLGPEEEVESEPEPEMLQSLLCRLEDAVIRLLRQVGGGPGRVMEGVRSVGGSWKGNGGEMGALGGLEGILEG